MAADDARGSGALAEYYGDPEVRARIREYCGLEPGAEPQSVFLSAALPHPCPPAGWEPDPKFPTAALDDLLDAGADVFRSMWDRGSLIIALDIDYLNAERAGHALARAPEVFDRIEPVYAAIDALLRAHRIEMLPMMTGRGYQFAGRVPLDSPVLAQLAAAAPEVPDWHGTQASRLAPWIPDRITPTLARAYAGAGMVLEHFAHLIVRRAAPRTTLPIVLNGTNVGYVGENGREAVSLDLSFAGDPIDERHLRTAFGGYQQHRFRPDIYGPEVSALDPLVVVPRDRSSLEEMLDNRGPDAAARLARSCSARMPDLSEGLAALTAAYRSSPLAEFHAAFYASEPHGPAEWLDTYDRIDLTALPPCVACPLTAPNDHLLKPEDLQHVTRFFLGEGWAPRHIAGLVWSRYEKDFGWGARWAHLSARTRAEFDVRVFAGLIATGLDRCIDYNCRSAQEKQLCPLMHCPYDLRVSRDKILARHA